MYIKLRRMGCPLVGRGTPRWPIEVVLRSSIRKGAKVQTKHVCALGTFIYRKGDPPPSDKVIKTWMEGSPNTFVLSDNSIKGVVPRLLEAGISRDAIPAILAEITTKLKAFDYSR